MLIAYVDKGGRMKSKLKKLVLGYGAAMAGWGAYSYVCRNKPVPTGEEAEEYKKSLLRTIGSGELYGTWREEVLPLEGAGLLQSRDITPHHLPGRNLRGPRRGQIPGGRPLGQPPGRGAGPPPCARSSHGI